MTTAAPPQQPDAERDAWLREALRHAPDADVAPPPALSELILREAHIKLRRPAAEPSRSIWTRLWIWSARPAVGAGLASVMLAGVIAGMWWDRPMQENSPRATSDPIRAEATLPPGEERMAAAPAAPPAAPTPAPQAAAVEHAADARAGAGQVTAPKSAKSLPQAPQHAAPLRREALSGDEPAAVTAAAPSETAPDALSKAARTADTMAPAAAAPAAPTSTGSTAPSFAAAPRAPAQTRAEATGQITAAAPRAAARERASPPEAERSFSALRLALSADPQPWSWQRAGAAAQPVGDALTAWLATIDRHASGRWAPGALEASVPTWRPLSLLHQGRVAHRLGLDGALLRWEDEGTDAGAPATVWQAPLDNAQAEQLRRALERFAP